MTSKSKPDFQVDVAKHLIQETESKLLQATLEYRLYNSFAMEGKATGEIAAEMGKMKRIKEQFARKLRLARAMLTEIENGELVI